ncbi:hypothetical protein [Desulfosarcina cetonica]|uniref:hypothetical protein n=1 Tax=Desulfosarcina cetonica TaxID=90730 RepID=UPI0012ED80FC|nr:hypothetical protein [Desulfosarcina cetonica]
MKFIHTADIHLDSPLHRLETYDGAPVEAIRQASRRPWKTSSPWPWTRRSTSF